MKDKAEGKESEASNKEGKKIGKINEQEGKTCRMEEQK